MSRSAFLAQARARTEAQFGDTCTVKRRNPNPTYDDTTGDKTYSYTTVYSGACRMKQPHAAAVAASAGEAQVLLQQPEIHLPMSGTVLRPDDEITITASVNDPQSVGRAFLVRAVPAGEGTTARRYGVIERTG